MKMKSIALFLMLLIATAHKHAHAVLGRIDVDDDPGGLGRLSAIPLALLIVALSGQAVAAPASFERDWIRLGVTAVVLGAVISYNTWDVPILWGAFSLAFLAGVLAGATAVLDALRERLRQLAILGLVAVLLYLPYFIGYERQALGVGLVSERTMFGSLVVLFGPLLVLVAVAGVVAAVQLWRLDETAGLPRWIPIAGPVVGLGLVALREPTLGFLVAALGLWLPVLWSRVRLGAPPAATMTALLAVAGYAVGALTLTVLGSAVLPGVAGFNFMLAAMAVGGLFSFPDRVSFAWGLFASFVAALLCMGLPAVLGRTSWGAIGSSRAGPVPACRLGQVAQRLPLRCSYAKAMASRVAEPLLADSGKMLRGPIWASRPVAARALPRSFCTAHKSKAISRRCN